MADWAFRTRFEYEVASGVRRNPYTGEWVGGGGQAAPEWAPPQDDLPKEASKDASQEEGDKDESGGGEEGSEEEGLSSVDEAFKDDVESSALHSFHSVARGCAAVFLPALVAAVLV